MKTCDHSPSLHLKKKINDTMKLLAGSLLTKSRWNKWNLLDLYYYWFLALLTDSFTVLFSKLMKLWSSFTIHFWQEVFLHLNKLQTILLIIRKRVIFTVISLQDATKMSSISLGLVTRPFRVVHFNMSCPKG